jgi:hypothetical protein
VIPTTKIHIGQAVLMKNRKKAKLFNSILIKLFNLN